MHRLCENKLNASYCVFESQKYADCMQICSTNKKLRVSFYEFCVVLSF